MAGRKRKRGVHGLPWYWKARDHWVVPGDKKKTPLRDRAGDVVRGPDSRDRAVAVWHETMSLANVGRGGVESEVKAILELYLQDMARRKAAAKTLKNYAAWFQSFVDHWGGLLVRDVKPFHVHRWWDEAKPGWGPSMRNLSGSALKAAFNWAVKPGKGGAIIPADPLAGMALPAMRKRSSEIIITEAEFEAVLALVKTEAIRDVLVVAWETGTRPVNLSRATARNVTDDGLGLLFADWNTDPDTEVHKTFKRTGRPLVVPLPGRAREVVQRLKSQYPEGRLFRTPRGLDWTEVRLATTVRHYAKLAGLDGRFTAYSCRHTRATALLEDGHTASDVAAMLGNTPAVIHRNYSHVSANVARLVKLMEAKSAK